MNKHNAEDFYNHIADKYNWFFSSWGKIMERQVNQISTILTKYNSKTILDCSCGNGLQAIGLSKVGYTVDGGDISQEMIDIASESAKDLDLNIDFKKSNFREIEKSFNKKYDVVLSWGNSNHHLMNYENINEALKSIYNHVEDNGIALLEMRNYDEMLKNQKRFLPMRINDIKDGYRYSILYVFDYLDTVIRFNIIYLIENLDTGEKRIETETVDYNPIKKKSLFIYLKELGSKTL